MHSFRSKVVPSLACLFVTATLVLLLIPFRTKTLIPSNQTWTAIGSFTRSGAYSSTQFDSQLSERDKRQLDFWGSWSGNDANTGELNSPIFTAPTILECYLSGYPGKPGLDLYVQRESDHLRVSLTVPGNSWPAEIWRSYHWWLPVSVRGQPVRLVATDNATGPGGWFGVSTPRRFSYLALLHQQLPSNLLFAGQFLLDFILFLWPGFALASFVIAKRPPLIRHALVLSVASSATLGYLAFYVFFFSNTAGRLLTIAIYISAFASLRYHRALRNLLQQLVEPLTLSAATALCYLCFAFLFVNPMGVGASYINGRFFPEIDPGDNLIPVLFAERIYDHKPLRPFCCGGWLTSDRPPLQTGIFLLERPLPWMSRNPELDYQLLATGLQCLWICGVWSLLASLGTTVPHIRISLAFLVFSGFVFYNSVYTWPKFLAASFILFAFSIVSQLLRDRREASFFEAILAGLCVGLALVSHPSSIFSLVSFVVIFFKFRSLFSLKKIVLLLPILLTFVLPWTAYQKLADPPGNRLIKWHLAGHTDVDANTAWQDVRDAYASRSPGQILALRWSNVAYLFGETPVERFSLPMNHAASEEARIFQREWVWHAVGILNAGWLVAVFFACRKQSNRPIPFSGWLVLIAVLNLLMLCAIEFGPKYTAAKVSSYADILLLSIGLLGFILQLPRLLISLLLALQILNLSVVWIWSPPYRFSGLAGPLNTVTLQLPLMIFGSILALLLLCCLGRDLFLGKLTDLQSRSPAA